MKKLSNIYLTAQNVLNQSDMKKVIGGKDLCRCTTNGEYTSVHNCSDEICEKLYGPGATCQS